MLTKVLDTLWDVDWPGATSRLIENQLVRDWHDRLDELKLNAQSVDLQIQEARELNNPEYVPLYAGQGAGAINEILPVAEIIQRMVSEAEISLARAAQTVTAQSTSA
jgi:nitronate monooxygenase